MNTQYILDSLAILDYAMPVQQYNTPIPLVTSPYCHKNTLFVSQLICPWVESSDHRKSDIQGWHFLQNCISGKSGCGCHLWHNFDELRSYEVNSCAFFFNQALDLTVNLMERNEECEIESDSKYCFGKEGKPPSIPPDASLTYNVKLLGMYGLLWAADENILGVALTNMSWSLFNS